MGLILRHSIVFTTLIFLFALAPSLAQACSCSQSDPEEFVRSVGQVFDGYVETVEEADTTGPYNGMKKATIRVLQVLKGEVPNSVTFSYGEADAACQYGALRLHATQRFFTYGDPSQGPVSASWCDRMAGHYGGDPLERELLLYASRLQLLRQEAGRGSVPSRLALAEFLLEYNGTPEAVRILQLVLQDDPKAFEEWVVNGRGYDHLGRVKIRWPPRTVHTTLPEPRGQVARAIFALTGRLDPTWKDWSDLVSLSQCQLDDVTLENVSFANSRLPRCSFRRARLNHVDFSGVQMSSGSFESARLSDVRFDDVSIYGTSFEGAHLERTSISGTLFVDLAGAELQDVTMTDVNLGGSGGSGLTNAKLKNVVFIDGAVHTLSTAGASFQGVQFKGTRLQLMKLQETDLRGADFSAAGELTAYVDCSTRLPDSIKADSPGLVPTERGCPLGRPDGNFRGAAWRSVDLSSLDFEGGDFAGASLSGVKLNGTNLAKANLSGVDLNYVSFAGANLDGATLSGATNLKWFAESKRGVTGAIDGPPASLRGTIFSGTTVPITALVGIAGHAASIDLDAPNFDNVTIDCWERPLDHYLTRPLRNDAVVAAQAMREERAIWTIRNKWPTAKLTDRCSALQ
jgi:uncharacterized protein YjbI with pentapeptide repeats